VVTAGILGAAVAMTVPSFLSYWQVATLKAGAEELVTVLNSGRQLAIRENTGICVAQAGTRVRYLLGSCAGTVWTGPGTDADGWIRLANGVEITASTAAVIFTYLGGATPAGTYTVTNPRNGDTLCVVVAASGRVRIQGCS
jgi:Tfp pilus assembly protein FimT